MVMRSWTAMVARLNELEDHFIGVAVTASAEKGGVVSRVPAVSGLVTRSFSVW
jgi:hypothetical protein